MANHKNEYITQSLQKLRAELKSRSFQPYLAEVNGNAGITAVSVPLEFYSLIVRSLQLQRITNGALGICHSSSSMNQDNQFAFDTHSYGDQIEINPYELSIYLPKSDSRLSFENILS